jgi:excisionase family DNA binding protein
MPTTHAAPIVTLNLPPDFAAAVAAEVAKRLDPNAAGDGYLDSTQAADYLSAPVGRIRDLAESGRLPTYRDGRRLLFRRADLDAYVGRRGASQ